jgi:hypothetical protein
MSGVRRRDVLKGTALALVTTTAARAGVVAGQAARRSLNSPTRQGRHPGWTRERDRKARRRGWQNVFRARSQRRAAGFLRRSDLWRQSRHGRLEDDRLSRRALRLSRLGGRHNERFPLPPVGITGRADWTPRKAEGYDGANFPQGCRHHRPRLDRLDHGERADGRGARRRMRSSAAHGATRRPIFRPTTIRTNCAIAFARTVPAAGSDDLHLPQQDDQTALPIRNWGAFMPGNGVGGGGVHWNARRGASCPPTSC